VITRNRTSVHLNSTSVPNASSSINKISVFSIQINSKMALSDSDVITPLLSVFQSGANDVRRLKGLAPLHRIMGGKFPPAAPAPSPLRKLNANGSFHVPIKSKETSRYPSSMFLGPSNSPLSTRKLTSLGGPSYLILIFRL